MYTNTKMYVCVQRLLFIICAYILQYKSKYMYTYIYIYVYLFTDIFISFLLLFGRQTYYRKVRLLFTVYTYIF